MSAGVPRQSGAGLHGLRSLACGENSGRSERISVILSGSEEPVLEVSPRAEGNCSAALKVHENYFHCWLRQSSQGYPIFLNHPSNQISLLLQTVFQEWQLVQERRGLHQF